MNGHEIRILVADADSAVREIIAMSAREQGFFVDEAKDGVDAIKRLRRCRYALLVLELELPVIDGLMVCEQYCAQSLVLMISRKKAETDRLDAFASGANDFLLKPFYPRELIARIKNLLKLTGVTTGAGREIKTGDIEINLDARVVRVDGVGLQLSPREYSLLVFLCSSPGKVFSREALLDMVWGIHFVGTDRTVDTHVKCLRDKVKSKACTIETVWGAGYRLVVHSRE